MVGQAAMLVNGPAEVDVALTRTTQRQWVAHTDPLPAGLDQTPRMRAAPALP